VDYAIVLAPDASSMARAYDLLAPRGVLNIFAGLNRGTQIPLDLNHVRAGREIRITGSSGPTIDTLRTALSKSLDRSLPLEQAVAAVTGLEGARQALQAMEQGRFSGKVVVYPQTEGLPLTTLEEMADSMPEVAACLGEGNLWTNAAERALLQRFLPH
jgi:D-arabinose 1-dehydrogenase-like Zn-dependent alcohol dehydrogenase